MRGSSRHLSPLLLALALAGAGCASGAGREADGGLDADAGGGADGADPGTWPDEDQPEDPCLGVTCDQPPDNACGQAEQELLVYEAIGDCDHATGDCVYEPRSIKCMEPCVDGACAGADLCAEALCNRPPSPICGADGRSIVRFAPEGSCDPVTGRCSYPSEEDACVSGCRFGRCLPPAGSDAALDVAPETFLCSFFWGGDLFEVYLEQGRLALRAGVHPLDLDAAELEVELFGSLELGPEGRPADPVGPARLFPSFEGSAEQGSYRVDIEQEFFADDRTYAITGRAIFEMRDGRLLAPVMQLDTDMRSRYDHFVLEGQYLPAGRFPMYSGCTVSWMEEDLRFDLENGDSIALQYGYAGLGCREQGACAGEPFPGRVLWAEATLDGAQRRIDDYFDLAFNTQHHEDGKAFLLVLDSPVGEVHALHIPPGTSQVFDRVHYLDAELEVLQTVPIVSIE
ncbi:MAG: hypothetical protein JXR96_12405 [Deltaproteobacteria bacterium]|nr:hypothetical protein [Deltaproteobacteria bacterium]